MRTFVLVRDVDVSGVSGTGIVCEGCQFSDGTAALRWRVDRAVSSTGVYGSIEDVEAIHGHNGATRVVFQYTGPVFDSSVATSSSGRDVEVVPVAPEEAEGATGVCFRDRCWSNDSNEWYGRSCFCANCGPPEEESK